MTERNPTRTSTAADAQASPSAHHESPRTPTTKPPKRIGNALRSILTATLLAPALLALTDTPALAGEPQLSSLVKPFVFVEPPTSFGSEGSGPGQFSARDECRGNLAVEASTGDVFVLDCGNARVEKFQRNSKGEYEFLSEFGGGTPEGAIETNEPAITVDNSSGPSRGDVYVSERYRAAVEKFEPAPTLAEPNAYKWVSQLDVGEPRDVAVDSKGDVYVSNGFDEGVQKFGPAGEELGTVHSSFSYGVAVAPNGDLYSIGSEGVEKFVFGPGGEVLATSVLAPGYYGLAVAVGPHGGVYISGYSASTYEPRILVYNSSGELLEEITPSGFVISVAFAPPGAPGASGYLYTFEEGPHARVFEEPPPAHPEPEIEGCSVTTPTPTSAVISCAVNPEAPEAHVYMEYGEFGSPMLTKTAEHIVTGSGEVKVELGGLTPQTLERARLAVANTTSSATGEEVVFREPAAVSGVGRCGVPDAAIENEGAMLHGSLEPRGAATNWRFEYGETTSYGSETKEETSESDGQVTPEPKIAGLKPHTTYHCRLVAHDQYGTTVGPGGEFTTTGAPILEGTQSFEKVGSVNAEAVGSFDPEGYVGKFAASSYHFEYGPTMEYGFKTPATNVPAEHGGVTARALLTGLQPSTEYHFRLVATDQYGTTQGPDLSFTTFAAIGSGLPDDRIYEMVSPPEDNNAEVYVSEGFTVSAATNSQNCCGEISTIKPFQVSPSGGAVAYVGDPSYGGGASSGNGEGNEYVATRGPAGWGVRNITPFQAIPSSRYEGFSTDLAESFFFAEEGRGAEPILPEAPDGSVLYSRTASDGSYHVLGVEDHYRGAAAEGGDFLTEGGGALEEWVDGRPDAVNVLPDGSPAPEASFGFPSVDPQGRPVQNLSHVISADGSRVFWTDRATNQLFVRENGATTVQVDASEVPGEEGGGGEFWTASGDGSRVFFSDTRKLTADAVAGSGANLYEYDVSSGELSDLTAAPEASVQFVFGASENGEYVYFAAEGALAAGATTGAENVYLRHGGETKFIATISPIDAGEPSAFNESGPAFGDLQLPLGWRTVEVAPDGRAIAFDSVNRLTAYENEGVLEVYVYEAETRTLFCASCLSTGEPPGTTPLPGDEHGTGHGGLVVTNGASFLPPGSEDDSTYLPQWLSEDGARVFFDSEAPLVAHDTNGQLDVYEWERDGSGSCRDARGCIYLISGGTSAFPSYFVGASQNGDDAFFETRAPLVQQDVNENMNLFDAHAGGVLAPSEAECTGTGCQGVPLAPTAFEAPSSATFDGVGNFPPPSPQANGLAKHRKAKHRKAKRKQARRKRGRGGRRTGRTGRVRRAANGAGRGHGGGEPTRERSS